MQVLAFKQANFIRKVDYAKLIAELYDANVSEGPQQDVYVKKLIANVNIGLLEKWFNKKSVGFLFQDYEECKYYKAQYGGAIHSVQRIEAVSELFERSLLGLDDGVDVVGPVVSVKFEHRGSPYFVLVLKAEKQLRSGVRDTKEFLAQGRNFKLSRCQHLLG